MTHVTYTRAMSAGEAQPTGRGTLFRVGWWALVVLTALFALNHLVGMAAFATSDDERLMFLAFAALQALSLIVLLLPYRRGEFWAWWSMWIPILAMAAPLLVFPFDALAATYGAVAGAMALAQFATLPWIRRVRATASP